MSREEHLKPPWPKGVSGNPNGRPKGAISLRKLLIKQLKELAKDGKPYAEHGIKRLVADFLAGKQHAVKLVFEQLEGMPDANFKAAVILRVLYGDKDKR